MASQRQIEANRRNAERSTGPKTAAGRAASSQNSRRHGLYADPPPELVLTFYRLIANNPEAHIALRSSSPLERASVRLAEAEARLCMARKVDVDHAAKCEEAIRRRANGASIEARPIYRAARKMRRLSQKKLDMAMCGDISVVPTDSLVIYAPHWRLMRRIGIYDEGCTADKAQLGFLLYSEDLLFAVDNAGRGKLPRDNLRLRACLEGARSRALTAWLQASAPKPKSPPEAAHSQSLAGQIHGKASRE
jgi:hypothetical protein